MIVDTYIQDKLGKSWEKVRSLFSTMHGATQQARSIVDCMESVKEVWTQVCVGIYIGEDFDGDKG